MPKTGRKSKFEELDIVKRYAALSEPFFQVLEKMLNSKVKADQRFAIEQLSKAFPKMIPTQLGGLDGKPIEVSWLSKSPTIHADGPSSSTKA